MKKTHHETADRDGRLGHRAGSRSAHATPEQDHQNLLKYFTSKYPDVKIDDYVYGALAFDPDGMAQYDGIMEFPPFDSVIDAGRKMWDTPFKNGKTYADCLPNGGKMVAGNYPMFDEQGQGRHAGRRPSTTVAWRTAKRPSSTTTRRPWAH